jgi:hypothetical protein
MSFTLTVQHRSQRCRCGRYLAWWTTGHAACCRCMRSSQDCLCAATGDPAEGCNLLDFDRVAEPDGQGPECE